MFILEQDLLDLYRKSILNLMLENNIAISQLARAVSVPQPTLYRLLKGKTSDIKLSTLIRIANFFSVSLTDFAKSKLDYEDSKNIALNQKVPILSWKELDKDLLKSESKNNYIYPSIKCSEKAFALKAKISFEAVFSKDTFFIVDPDVEVTDGDYAIVCYRGSLEAALRRVIVDGPVIEFRKITGSDHEMLTDEIKIIGTVLQTVVIYKNELML